jgi:hypothetical protein
MDSKLIKMKNNSIVLFLLLAIAFGCSSDNSALASGDGTGGSLAIFVLKGNYLYSVDNHTLNVFSLLNEQLPVKVNDVQIGFNIETLFSFEDKLYIGSQNGMFIYSIQNPENPTYVSEAQHFTACDPVISNGNTTFVTLHSNTNCGNNLNVLQVYDTSNPVVPQLIHSRNLTLPKGIGLYGNYLFVCDDALKIFDVSNPQEPVLVHVIDKECFDVIIKDNDLFAIGLNGMYRYSLNPNDITNTIFKSQLLF